MWRSVNLKLSRGHFEYLKHGLHFEMTADKHIESDKHIVSNANNKGFFYLLHILF